MIEARMIISTPDDSGGGFVRVTTNRFVVVEVSGYLLDPSSELVASLVAERVKQMLLHYPRYAAP